MSIEFGGGEIQFRSEVAPKGASVYALEGMGGVGKSHISKLLASEMTKEGRNVVIPKIGGLGDSPRVTQLKNMQEQLTQVENNGGLNIKQQRHQDRDTIFRLAIRHQVKLFADEIDNSGYDIAILDRTPLMSYVFAAANTPNSPYLKEIYEEGMETTQRLRLSKVFLLDVEPETAYARMIARYCMGDCDVEAQVLSACKAIHADSPSTLMIMEKVCSQLENMGNIHPKQFESWDLIPIEVTKRERDLHKEVLHDANQRFGLKYELIDAEGPINTVLDKLTSAINK